jgi:glucose/arabinose dehydrogenase
VRRAIGILAVALLALPSVTAAHQRRHHHHKRHDERVLTSAPPATRHVLPPPEPPPPKPLTRLQVVAREWSVVPSKLTLPAGRVVVELDNLGQDPHDLRIERANDPTTGFDFTLARAGTRETQSLQLGPGTWKLFCTLPGHEALGMHAVITVGG